ncbi:hypothetical protein [Noviherbaspirillum pedocola]|uniref:Copper-binding protein n=1 Tax=Noviherbaspirillum pedocola TaxID=2801341 RepID=A0A934SW27_9BURK|nr:hypothetical protein [Noviherbaspirillum pedocola]MBK4736669.1 hypothetical protein [Noviherbaspirillum pedocola]
MQMSKSFGMGLGGLMIVLAASYAAMRPDGSHDAAAPHAGHAQVAGTVTPAASTAPRTIRISIAPGSDAAPGVWRLRKNEAVDFRVSVPYDGMLAIHGYTNDVPVAANHELSLPLTLSHTGRFPMHVHARDGQHLEVAVLEILPD